MMHGRPAQVMGVLADFTLNPDAPHGNQGVVVPSSGVQNVGKGGGYDKGAN